MYSRFFCYFIINNVEKLRLCGKKNEVFFGTMMTNNNNNYNYIDDDGTLHLIVRFQRQFNASIIIFDERDPIV